MEEIIEFYVTQLRILATKCEFETVRDGLILYMVVDGIRSDQLRNISLRKGGTNLNKILTS